MILTQEYIFAALHAERIGETFPIDLDDVWQPLGYSRKHSAKRALIANLIEGEDYLIDYTSMCNFSTTGFSNPQEKAAFSTREVIREMPKTPERQVRKHRISYFRQGMKADCRL